MYPVELNTEKQSLITLVKLGLTKGVIAILEKWDYDRLPKASWHLSSGGYAAARIKGKLVFLHRLIMGNPDAEVDHRNGNKLDNTRKNLRIATRAQNSYNKTKYKNNTSGLKGVFWSKDKNRWKSQIQADGKLIFLGYFNEATEASKAYQKAALQLHGEFANV